MQRKGGEKERRKEKGRKVGKGGEGKGRVDGAGRAEGARVGGGVRARCGRRGGVWEGDGVRLSALGRSFLVSVNPVGRVLVARALKGMSS